MVGPAAFLVTVLRSVIVALGGGGAVLSSSSKSEGRSVSGEEVAGLGERFLLVLGMEKGS